MTDPWCCYIWCAMDPINIPQMLAYIYIYHTWILWDTGNPETHVFFFLFLVSQDPVNIVNSPEKRNPIIVIWLVVTGT